MAKNRPSWKKGVRDDVKTSQNDKCAWCDQPLTKVYEVHHDYRGMKWSGINKIIESDDMKALGVDGKAAKGIKTKMYHDRRSLYAMHPDCHREADKAQEEGRVMQNKVGRA